MEQCKRALKDTGSSKHVSPGDQMAETNQILAGQVNMKEAPDPRSLSAKISAHLGARQSRVILAIGNRVTADRADKVQEETTMRKVSSK